MNEHKKEKHLGAVFALFLKFPRERQRDRGREGERDIFILFIKFI